MQTDLIKMAMTLASKALASISHYTGSEQSAPSGPSATELNTGTSLAVFDAQRPKEDSGPTSRLTITGPEDTLDGKSLTVFGAPPPIDLSGSPTSQLALYEPDETQATGWVEDGSLDSDDPDVADGQTSDLSVKNLGISTSAHYAAREPWGARMRGWANAAEGDHQEQTAHGTLAVVDRGSRAREPVLNADTVHDGNAPLLLSNPPSVMEEFDAETNCTAEERIEQVNERIKADQLASLASHRKELQKARKESRSIESGTTIMSCENDSACDTEPMWVKRRPAEYRDRAKTVKQPRYFSEALSRQVGQSNKDQAVYTGAQVVDLVRSLLSEMAVSAANQPSFYQAPVYQSMASAQQWPIAQPTFYEVSTVVYAPGPGGLIHQAGPAQRRYGETRSGLHTIQDQFSHWQQARRAEHFQDFMMETQQSAFGPARGHGQFSARPAYQGGDVFDSRSRSVQNPYLRNTQLALAPQASFHDHQSGFPGHYGFPAGEMMTGGASSVYSRFDPARTLQNTIF